MCFEGASSKGIFNLNMAEYTPEFVYELTLNAEASSKESKENAFGTLLNRRLTQKIGLMV